jgi:hypothetical protein
MERLDAESINYEVKKSVNTNAVAKTDGYSGYAKLREVIKLHESVVVKDKTQIDKVFRGYTPVSVMQNACC